MERALPYLRLKGLLGSPTARILWERASAAGSRFGSSPSSVCRGSAARGSVALLQAKRTRPSRMAVWRIYPVAERLRLPGDEV